MQIKRNWLIRTRDNQILGPISKKKIIELFENGSLDPNDEVCSGNGYWFFLKEKDLVDQYIYGEVVQEFNPVSEGKDVLTAQKTEQESLKLPSDDDLAYPEIASVIIGPKFEGKVPENNVEGTEEVLEKKKTTNNLKRP